MDLLHDPKLFCRWHTFSSSTAQLFWSRKWRTDKKMFMGRAKPSVNVVREGISSFLRDQAAKGRSPSRMGAYRSALEWRAQMSTCVLLTFKKMGWHEMYCRLTEAGPYTSNRSSPHRRDAMSRQELADITIYALESKSHVHIRAARISSVLFYGCGREQDFLRPDKKSESPSETFLHVML